MATRSLGGSPPTPLGFGEEKLAAEIAGLDALEAHLESHPSRARRVWSTVWPKLAAVAIALLAWQAVVWSGWREPYQLPGPGKVLPALADLAVTGKFWKAVGITMRRAVSGYALALVIGSVLGIAVARFRLLRTAVGSLITGLQTMPSIAWFPIAILLFGLTEQAIMFVVVLGAAPSIANGLIAGVDHVPPLMLRAGRMIGAKGVGLYRHVVLPAALPTYVAGLKQGWAFAWRSLMAGELLVIVASRPSIGAQLQFARDVSAADEMMAIMIVILVIGIVVDTVFGRADVAIRRRWGLIEHGT
ncbi:MAG TPA: ABC transporter permease [Acidimicrobiales bacterium]|nr:ABC transporter permease [Acidimicrobiales bacterium]